MPIHKGRNKATGRRSAQIRTGPGAKAPPIEADGRAPKGKEFPEQGRDTQGRVIKFRK